MPVLFFCHIMCYNDAKQIEGKVLMKKRIFAVLLIVAMTTGLMLQGFAAGEVSVGFVKSYMRSGQLFMQFSISCLHSGTYWAELVAEDGTPVVVWQRQPIETQAGVESAVKSFSWEPGAEQPGRYIMIVTTKNIYGQTSAVSLRVVLKERTADEEPLKYEYVENVQILPAQLAPNPEYDTGVYLLEGSNQAESGLMSISQANEGGAYVFEFRRIVAGSEKRTAGLILGGEFETSKSVATFNVAADKIEVNGLAGFDGMYKLSTAVIDVGSQTAALFAAEVCEMTAAPEGDIVDDWFWPVTAGEDSVLVARDLSAVYMDKALIWGSAASMLAEDKLISKFGIEPWLYVENIAGKTEQLPEEPYYTPHVKVYPESRAAIAGQKVKILADVPGDLAYTITAVPGDRGLVSFKDGSLETTTPCTMPISGTIEVDGEIQNFTFEFSVVEPHISFTSVPAVIARKSNYVISAVVVGAKGEITFSLSDESIAKMKERAWIEGVNDGVVTLTASAGNLSVATDVAVGNTKLYADVEQLPAAEGQEGEAQPQEGGRFSWPAFFMGSGMALVTVLIYRLHKQNRARGINPNDYRQK